MRKWHFECCNDRLPDGKGSAMLAHDADSKQLSEHSEKPLEEGVCLSEGTRAALAEFDAMKEYPERYRRCRSFDEMLQDVLAGK